MLLTKRVLRKLASRCVSGYALSRCANVGVMVCGLDYFSLICGPNRLLTTIARVLLTSMIDNRWVSRLNLPVQSRVWFVKDHLLLFS